MNLVPYLSIVESDPVETIDPQINIYALKLAEGDVRISLPDSISPQSEDELRAWFRLVLLQLCN